MKNSESKIYVIEDEEVWWKWGLQDFQKGDILLFHKKIGENSWSDKWFINLRSMKKVRVGHDSQVDEYLTPLTNKKS